METVILQGTNTELNSSSGGSFLQTGQYSSFHLFYAREVKYQPYGSVLVKND